MTDTREDRKKIILQTAFDEWGKDHFTTTSLSLLADRLGITKAGLYRYFSGKDALLQEMENMVFEEFGNQSREFVDRAADADLEHTLRLFVQTHFLHYSATPKNFLFLIISFLKGSPLQWPKLKTTLEQELLCFSRLFEREGLSTSKEKMKKTLRRFFTTGVFWMNLAFHRKLFPPSVPRPLTREKAEFLRKTIHAICLRGLGGGTADPPFSAIEKACEVKTEEMPESDRIFSAVAEVVAREGFGGATIDKIASRAGMTKSSLYFYFQNKDDMLGSLVRRELLSLNEVFQDRVKAFSSLEEKLYCLICVTASYMRRNETFMITFNWLWFQGVQIKIGPPDLKLVAPRLRFLQDAVDSGRLESYGLDIRSLFAFLNLLILTECLIERRLVPERPPVRSDMRSVYHFFLHGASRS